MGLIKSAIGIGALLHDGIGATIRVSLTDDPIQEIAAAKDILKCMGLRGGPELVACPTCGRTRIDLVQTAKEVEAALANVDKDIKVAVMGCVVNGPGEAREADIPELLAEMAVQYSLKREKFCGKFQNQKL